MKKEKSYVYTKKKQPIFKFVQFIFRLSYKKPKLVINHNDEFPTDGLLVGPHMKKQGPFYLSMYYPKKCAIIGAYPMLGSYKERFHYLRDIYYMQKNHKGKFSSTFKAAFEAIFSIYIYKGMHLIPSYDDIRLMNTIRFASKTMENGLPIFIFPENSDNGYQNVMKGLHEGFIALAKFVGKKLNREIPIYPYYVNPFRRILIIGKPYYLSSLKDMSNEEILKYTEDRINELNPNLEEDKKNDPLYNAK